MNILIVDDEQHIRESIKRLLEIEKIDAQCAATGEEAKKLLLEHRFDGIILDLRLPGISGQQLLEWLRSEGFTVPVVMISAHGEINDAVQALKTGAQDYLIKPFDPNELIIRIREVVSSRKRKELLEVESRTVTNKPLLIGNSSSMKEIDKMIDRIAAAPSTVLITGESGTGKELVAREIHDRSPGKDEPFVAVNMGGIPENLMESELFGHEKGAFTGADSRKKGLFELAGRGTLFLDEVGETTMTLQVKLLRALQERKIRRLGGTTDMPVEARIISATNKDLEKEVKDRQFREDLFYRLNVLRVHISPLRERTEDIAPLAEYLLQKLSRRMGISGMTINPEGIKLLERHCFPGNVRELENVLERAVIYRSSFCITEKDINRLLPESDYDAQLTEKKSETSSVKEAEKTLIINALKKWKGNRTRAAEEIGISRRTIINKIKKYNINE